MNNSLPATTLAIFGVRGDLSQRKLLPALAEICRNPEFKERLEILGLSRLELKASESLPEAAGLLASQFEVLQMDYSKASEYKKLKNKLLQLGSKQVIFYFAVPPEAVMPIVSNLGRTGLNSASFKLLMEKPFGADFQSAKKLIDATDKYFKEEQVFRIDHFLAKEMAQNIAVFLGSNAIFRDVWNNNYIKKLEVVAEESIGIENRANFYEQTGAIRDIVQSHLLQLTALTIMEPCPDIFNFSQMRIHRLAALGQLEAKKNSAIKAQYQGYKDEVGNPDSMVETFAALELRSKDPKWQGVPIRLITGKRLKEKLTEIRIFFKKAQSSQGNVLRLRVQPREGIELDLWVKKPGYEQELQMRPLDFNYGQYFDRLPDAYEQVIVDAVRGRANLFADSQEVLASWRILQPLLGKNDRLRSYKSGSTVDEILKNT